MSRIEPGSREEANVETIRRYLTAIESGAVGDDLTKFYNDDVIQIEYPNRLNPNGVQRYLSDLREAAVRGKKVMSAQSYGIVEIIASGEWVALEAEWTGTLAVPFGNIPQGGQMRARVAIFFILESDGTIILQKNFDCFYPF